MEQAAITGPVPAERVGETLVYDPLRDRLLMFGGTNYDVSYQDVWALTLGGTPTWSMLAPPAAAGRPLRSCRDLRSGARPDGRFGGYSAPIPITW